MDTNDNTTIEGGATTGTNDNTTSDDLNFQGDNYESNVISGSSNLTEQDVKNQQAEEYKVPDKYINPDTGEPDYDKLTKSYLNLEKKLSERYGSPETIDGYQSELDSNFDAELNSDFKQFALENNLSPSQYDSLMKYYNEKGLTANSVPEKYEFDYDAKGYSIDSEMTEDFNEIAKEIGLSQQQYETLVDIHFKAAGMQSSPEMTKQTLTNEWGRHYDTNLATAKEAFKAYGDGVNAKAIGNNPEVLKLLANIGRDLKEDSAVKTKTGNGGMTLDQAREVMARPDYYDRQDLQDSVSRFFAAQ